MGEPMGSTRQSPVGFNLQLEHDGSSSLSKSPRRSRQGSSFMDVTTGEFETNFAGLEALDPRKRELLETRFTSNSGRLNNENSNASVSSAGSDKVEVFPETPSGRSEKHAGRKRKAAVDNSPGHGQSKTGRSDTGFKAITEYFKNDSQAQTRSPVNLLPSFASVQPPPQFSEESRSTLPRPVAMLSNHTLVPVDIVQDGLDSSGISVHESTQTDLNMKRMEEIDRIVTCGLKSSQQKDGRIDDLRRLVDDYKQQLTSQQDAMEKLKKNLEKCMTVNRELLITASTAEKKEVRERCMKNRLRLGQFVPARQGHQFVETWVEGYSFKEIAKKQANINQQREEIEKQKKLLVKKKPQTGNTGKEKKSVKGSGDSDTFARPQSPVLSPSEYYEKDEILKLRAAALKKEETELQIEFDKLDKERNLHIRELKRIHNEDNSRFKDHPTLHQRYLLLNLLGKGGFSEVYKGFDLKEQRYVACKIHQLNKDWKADKQANYVKHALREYDIHKTLNHPRIVCLYDVFDYEANGFCTILEYCDGQDLDFLLKQHKTVPEREAKSIIMQTVSALKYLNEIKPPVIHYDLKPGNILLTGTGALSGEVKITDFGLSKIMETEEDSMDLTSQGAGTYWYLPPECFVVGHEPPKISSKVDVWSVGVIFYQMLYGRRPFGHNMTQAAILETNAILKAREVEFPPKPVVSTEAKNFIRRCLAYRKEDRADVLILCEDGYLKPPVSGKKSSSSIAPPQSS